MASSKTKRKNGKKKLKRKIKIVGLGMKKSKRKFKQTNQMGVNKKQLAGIVPLEELDLYKAQLATRPK